jgi:hypothetical protein
MRHAPGIFVLVSVVAANAYAQSPSSSGNSTALAEITGGF